MARIMPTQVVQTIDDWFPRAKQNERSVPLVGVRAELVGILNLLKDVPNELIILAAADYAELILAKSAIEEYLARTTAREDYGILAQVKGYDVTTVIRRVLAKCPDEYPPPTTTELLFIKDGPLRENIRQDLGDAHRALNNHEWKGATVLAGATIEALLHWRLKQPSPGEAAVQKAVAALVAKRVMSQPDKDIDRWELHHFIEVAAHLKLLKPDSSTAANLARGFRNLILPGRAARLAQTRRPGSRSLRLRTRCGTALPRIYWSRTSMFA
jgi:hypothetical protein